MYGVPEVRSPAPRTVAWWLPLDEEKLKDEERAFIAEITSREPLLKASQTLTKEFHRLLRDRGEAKLDEWFTAVEGSGVADFKNFAKPTSASKAMATSVNIRVHALRRLMCAAAKPSIHFASRSGIKTGH